MAKLTLMTNDQPEKSTFLTDKNIVIGRTPSCAIHIDVPGILPEHARVSLEEGHYVITSTEYGVQLHINHGYTRQHILSDGDVIHFGAYTLLYSARVPEQTDLPNNAPTGSAWLQVLNGDFTRRAIRLTEPVTRLGNTSKQLVTISRHNDGYYLSPLESGQPPEVNHAPINGKPRPLNDGDRIRIGQQEFEFFYEYGTPVQTTDEPAAGHVHQQRQSTRVSLQYPALLTHKGEALQTRVIDLSLSGVLIERPYEWTGKTGDRHSLHFRHGEHVQFTVEGIIRQCRADRLGLCFVKMDKQIKTRIRWLVELNLGDAALLNRELSELG